MYMYDIVPIYVQKAEHGKQEKKITANHKANY